jgi:heme/copper-type cytochrome/quinol oxidase subunit 3
MHSETQAAPLEEVLKSDWGGGKSPFGVSWGKLMMWLFILSDAFTFGGLLAGYGASAAADSYHDFHPCQQQRLDGAGSSRCL